MSQLPHYFELALRSFRASKALSLLMVLALGLGIGACMTTLTVYHVLSGDPIPSKSSRLFSVQLDAASLPGFKPGDEPDYQLGRADAEALLRDKRGQRQLMTSAMWSSIEPPAGGTKPFFTNGRMTTADFFAMFETPFLHGSGWDAQADEQRAPVAVVGQEFAQKVFGRSDVVGQTLRVRGVDLRVIGVLKPWRPAPHFFDLSMGSYNVPADFFMPFSVSIDKRMGRSGSMNCWDDLGGADTLDLNAPCTWIQYWVELPSAADAPAYRQYLEQYSEAQRQAGRYQRPVNVRLRDVMQGLVQRQVLPGDVRLQVWLAFGFLLVCLTNTVGLLLARALRRSGEIGVRRALGAGKGDIFQQFLVEAGALGLVGGLLGLLLSAGGLWLVRHSPAEYAELAQMDWPMLALTFGLAMLASLVAGLLPAWRAAGVTPAQQLKTQ
jgi:putative ABC transport system permease protein